MHVIVSERVIKDMNRFPSYVKNQIAETITMLEGFPLIMADIKKLGPGVYRVRRGKYRILFRVENDIIVVFEIGKRGRISYAKG